MTRIKTAARYVRYTWWYPYVLCCMPGVSLITVAYATV